jgi:molecular chaperone GrpE
MAENGKKAKKDRPLDCRCEGDECFCEPADGKKPAKAAEGKPAAPKAEAAEQDYYDQLLRLKADFENYRKRVERERPELMRYGKAELVSKLLPLYDMLLQAHAHITAAGGNGAQGDLVKGLEMIFREFTRLFEAEGIRPMETVGKPYDPMACEIMGVVETDEAGDGRVVDELQKGFYYGDKVLRPARVRIGKCKAQAPRPPEEGGEAETR